VLIALPDGSIGMLTVRNKATKEVDAYVQRFHMMKRNLFTLRVTIGSREEKGKNNTYFLPTFTLRPAEEVPAEDQVRYFEAIGFYAEMFKASSADTHGEEVKEPGQDGAGGHIDTTATSAGQAFTPPPAPSDLPPPDDIGF
jgi:hypothetical protein